MGRSRYKIHEEEYPYFITSSIIGYYPIFEDKPILEIIVNSLSFLVEQRGVQLFAYVIMPDHFHLICKGNNLGKKISEFKSYTARRIIDYLVQKKNSSALEHFRKMKAKHKTDREFQVWMEGFHPKHITNKDVLNQKIEYIHHNPVKAGLVESAFDWEFSFAKFYEGMDSEIELTHSGEL